jgi:threonine aldolase
MKIIDLRSDTVTLPTERMRKAMYEAELGDDVRGEDPTVNRLEELAAGLMGKEASIFTPSGTMSNLLAVLAQTKSGDEIILGSEAHILWYEVGGAAAVGGVIMRTIPNDSDGTIAHDALRETIRGRDIHFPPTTLLCLENTHNRCGGAVLTPDYTTGISELAHQNGLLVHLDGARIFSAAIALGIPAAELAKPVDSVGFCLSKNLSAPIGSLLCGTKEFVRKSRKYRKMLGGGMRQSGIVAAAGIVAIEHGIDRLVDDHNLARQLAQGLDSIAGIGIEPANVQTNIVVFEIKKGLSAVDFIEQMDAKGVRLSYFGKSKVRAVTHRMINGSDIDEALNRIGSFMKGLATAGRSKH